MTLYGSLTGQREPALPIPRPVQLLLVNYLRVYRKMTHDEALREVDQMVRYVETNWP